MTDEMFRIFVKYLKKGADWSEVRLVFLVKSSDHSKEHKGWGKSSL